MDKKTEEKGGLDSKVNRQKSKSLGFWFEGDRKVMKS